MRQRALPHMLSGVLHQHLYNTAPPQYAERLLNTCLCSCHGRRGYSTAGYEWRAPLGPDSTCAETLAHNLHILVLLVGVASELQDATPDSSIMAFIAMQSLAIIKTARSCSGVVAGLVSSRL